MSVYVRDLDYMVPTGPLSLSYLYFSVVHFFTFFSFCPTFRNFLRVNLIFVSLLLFYFYPVLLVGSSSSTHVSGQRAAWPNAGLGLSSSVTT